MISLDRKSAPALQTLSQIPQLHFQKLDLNNGLPVYHFHAADREILRMEWIYPAGKVYQTKKLAAALANRSLREGTNQRSAEEIAEHIDYFGGSLRTSAGMEYTTTRLFCRTKDAQELLPLIHEVLTEPTFPEEKLSVLVNRRKQALEINLKKNDYVASRMLANVLFGDNHPYGDIAALSDFDAINREDLMTHYQNRIANRTELIMLAGNADKGTLSMLNDQFGSVNRPTDSESNFSFTPISHPELEHQTNLPGSVQAAIRIGCRTITKDHPDFIALSVVNTILGGYFGSRLMSNIREEKGFTYGIYSGISALKHDGYFTIGTEVAQDYLEPTLEEIKKELNRLQNEVVQADELDRVKNYILGKTVKTLDGSFKQADFQKGLLLYNLSSDYLNLFIDEVKSIGPERIKDLAGRYLDYEKMHKVIVA